MNKDTIKYLILRKTTNKDQLKELKKELKDSDHYSEEDMKELEITIDWYKSENMLIEKVLKMENVKVK